MARTKAAKAIVAAVNKIVQEYRIRLTIRQIYYRLVSPPYQLFPNTLRSYKNLIAILTRARETGEVDWTRIEDRRRHWSGGETGDDSPESFLDQWESRLEDLELYYSQNRWGTQDKLVQVWVEKEALASLFEQAAQRWGVRVFPTVGYSSLTMFMEAVSGFKRTKKKIMILDFRDHDPSGVDMTRDAYDRLAQYAALMGDPALAHRIEVKRIALTIEQVQSLGLASNPTKLADSRSPAYVAQYGDECWELDAYPPDDLSELVSKSVEAEIDMDAWNKVEAETERNREIIRKAKEAAQGEIQSLLDRLREEVEEGRR